MANLTYQPTDGYPQPVITHADFAAQEKLNAFITVTINMGADQLTIFLPFGGRIRYEQKETK